MMLWPVAAVTLIDVCVVGARPGMEPCAACQLLYCPGCAGGQ